MTEQYRRQIFTGLGRPGPGKLDTVVGLSYGMIRFNNCLWATLHDVRKPEPNLQEEPEVGADAWRLVRPQSA
jgi:hypothetical protein